MFLIMVVCGGILPILTISLRVSSVLPISRPGRILNGQGDNPDPGTSAAPYRVYNIGNNNPVELMHLIETLEKSLGKVAVKNYMPIQPGDVPATWADVDALSNDVGFRPATSIEDGVERFVEWYKGYYS